VRLSDRLRDVEAQTHPPEVPLASDVGPGEPSEDVLEILRSELQRTMVLMGCRNVHELDASWLIPFDPLVGTT
jgi:FMN-dependent dehydrogenase.